MTSVCPHLPPTLEFLRVIPWCSSVFFIYITHESLNSVTAIYYQWYADDTQLLSTVSSTVMTALPPFKVGWILIFLHLSPGKAEILKSSMTTSQKGHYINEGVMHWLLRPSINQYQPC